MIRRRLLRSLSSTAFPKPNHYNLSILDSTQKDIVASLPHSRALDVNIRIRLSRYIEAVLAGDITGATRFLRSAVTRSSKNDSNQLAQLFHSCCLTLLNHLVSVEPFRMTLSEAKQVSDVVINHGITQRSDQEVETLLVVVLLRSLHHLQSNKMAQVSLTSYIRQISKKFQLSPEVVWASVKSKCPQVTAQFNTVFNRSEIVENSEHSPLLSTFKKLKESNRHTFEDLCKFIEQASFEYPKFEGLKYHEIYDQLPESERAQFMSQYLEFNRSKQLIIEELSQNVHKPLHSEIEMAGFQNSHRKWIETWLSASTDALRTSVKDEKDMQKYGYVISILTPDWLASLCLSHMLSAVTSSQIKVSTLSHSIAVALRHRLKTKTREWRTENYISPAFNTDHAVELVCNIMKVISEACIFTEFEANDRVFTFTMEKDEDKYSKYKSFGVLQVHPAIIDQFKAYRDLFQAGSYHLPMVHPPRKWTSPENGGFLSIQVPFVTSFEQETTMAYMVKAHRTGQLDSTYLALNALGSSPWTINSGTLSVFNALFKTPNSPALPATLANINLKNEIAKPTQKDFPDDDSFNDALSKWRSIDKEVKRKSKDAHKLLVYYEMVNRLANALDKNGEVFYLPHNMDFRGRVYPSVSFLSHYNEDLVRSLMLFWEAKPLGQHGYNYLMYQLANLFNKTKLTMAESSTFVDANRHNIIDSAEHSVDGARWWMKADTPWQTLALCKELNSIWKAGGNVADYRSRIPIHQDGTCNGLQHYAALGADEEAARSVNVLPNKTRQDVYTTVLSIVTQKVQNDLESESPEIAEMTAPLLSRSLIKQTVMTTVYGVTHFGARRQIRKRIDELLSQDENSLTDVQRAAVASYVSTIVLSSISELFAGARLIQNWLLENCSRCIQAINSDEPPEDFFDRKRYRPMMWTSVSGFPVVQLYRKNPHKTITTALQNITMKDFTKVAPIDEFKSKNGIAPNFIHSIDAIHMMMTCLGAQESGISFVSIHDSFWTHANDVPTLSRIIREQFALLHSSNIIENLQKDMMYVNRNSYQLVWVKNNVDAEFCRELNSLRGLYGKGGTKTELLNACLAVELRNPANVQDLVAKHKPQLLYQPSKDALIYSTLQSDERKGQISPLTHVPLLVPVQILEAPSVGTLDIEAVLNSEFFFS